MKTPITYYGGKQTMLKHILPLIPQHDLYCEPFCGGAAVFFGKPPAKVNVINDLNGELVNFYRTAAAEPDALRAEIARTLHSRAQHEHALHVYTHPDFFTPVARAWAVLVLSKLGFAGQLSTSFGFDKSECRHPRKLRHVEELLADELVALLQSATIECDDAFAVIRRYDCPHAWHFLDPPYVGSNMGHYSNMFNDQHLDELLRLCAALRGKWMLTMYPNDRIAAAAKQHGWRTHAVERTVTAAKGKRRQQEEWMVCNYET